MVLAPPVPGSPGSVSMPPLLDCEWAPAASEQTIAIRASVRPKEARIHIFLLLPKIDLFQSLFEEARRCYHKTRGYGSAFIQGIAGARKAGSRMAPRSWSANVDEVRR